MLFNSIDFIIFLPIVCLLYFIIKPKYRNIWLLFASYFFYMCWNVKYILLIFLITVISFLAAILIEKVKESKKVICVITCVICVILLGVFKYFDFVLTNINYVASMMHIPIIENPFDFVLPVGISFYTFQAMGYIIDVYRKDTIAEKNFINYALFLSFFPQLVAGPIERSNNLLKQVNKIHTFEYSNFKEGIFIMLWGFFLKIVVADRASVIVDEVFTNYTQYSGSICLIAVLLFSVQIYCDFNGYTYIARGAAKIMGFSLIENFKQPYFACGIKDFWRRWHLSLSQWLRDYLYIPLGGNRRGKLRKYINLMCTFLVSGLWHGASWNFIIWGGMHGIYQIVEDIFHNLFKNSILSKKKSHVGYILGVLITFVLVVFAWIYFRADNIVIANSIVVNIIKNFCIEDLLNGTLFSLGWGRGQLLGIFFSILVVLIVDFVHEKNIIIYEKTLRLPKIAQYMVWYAILTNIVLAIVQSYGANAASFIYFQF